MSETEPKSLRVQPESSIDQKKELATEHLRQVFSDNGRLTFTQSPQGNPRVRAHFADEDGYAGHVSGSHHLGVVRLTRDGVEVFVAEQHYPHRDNTPTYLWEFTPDTGELQTTRYEGDGNEEQLDLMTEANEGQVGSFYWLALRLAGAYPMNDLENSYNKRILENFRFRSEELQ